MPKRARELSALEVGRLKKAGYYSVGGVPGLALKVGDEKTTRSWILRYSVGETRRDMGLGSASEVSLAEARAKAKEARALLRDGRDPLTEAKVARAHALAAQAQSKTFEYCAKAYIEAKSPEWKNAKHAWQWQQSLIEVAAAKIGQQAVSEIELPHILSVLEPIWKSTPESAQRLRGRLELVLDWATVRGYREGANPARWRGHLEAVLPNPAKFVKVEHFESLPPAAVPEFMTQLRAVEGISAVCLEFTILCASRSGETRLARWSEIDFAGAVWHVPAERMKRKVQHDVPLSSAALKLLKALPKGKPDELVFPSPRGDGAGPMSDMAMLSLLRRLEVPAVVHGFRSSFRVWCAESTNVASEVAEAALAHGLKSQVEAAYMRSNLFYKRITLMERWAQFLSGSPPAATGTPITRKNGARAAASG